MKRLAVCFFIVLFLCVSEIQGFAFENESLDITVLSPAGETYGGYPVFERYSGRQESILVFKNTFIEKFIELYREAVKYKDMKSEPIYLVLKPESGCYGRTGFYLKAGETLDDKREVPYIELDKAYLDDNSKDIQSIAQLFSHEMGHVLLKLTAPDLVEPEIGSIDIHYSNVITDYYTAFSEGFAEHFEIISRLEEDNQELRSAIDRNTEKAEKKINKLIPKIKRDFVLPMRLDYYRAAAVLWFQQFEAIKRQNLPVTGDCAYKNGYSRLVNVEKTLLYRDTGLWQDKDHKRSLAQSLSTEAVISRFFFLLRQNGNDPLVEHYGKVFNVFNKHISTKEGSPLIEFVKGYLDEYPQERVNVLKSFREATGYVYMEETAPQIWLITKSPHIVTQMDSFGAFKAPVYCFNINTCEVDDLLKLPGITKGEAERIISYRDSKGYFGSMGEFYNIEGISHKTMDILYKFNANVFFKDYEADFQKAKLRNMEGILPGIMVSSLRHLLIKNLLIFAVFFLIYYFIVRNNRKIDIKKIFKQYIKFLSYTFFGLMAVFLVVSDIFGNIVFQPVIFFVIMVTVAELLVKFCFNRNRKSQKGSLILSILMSGIVIYSLV